MTGNFPLLRESYGKASAETIPGTGIPLPCIGRMDRKELIMVNAILFLAGIALLTWARVGRRYSYTIGSGGGG